MRVSGTLTSVNTAAFILKVLRLAKPYRVRLATGIVCGFLAGLCNPLLMVSVKVVVETVFPQPGAPSLATQLEKAPAVLRPLLDQVLPWLPRPDAQGSKVAVLLLISLIPLSMLLRGLLSYLNFYLMNWVSIRTVMDLRVRLFGHLQSLPPGFFSKTSTGTLMARLQAAGAVQSALGNCLVTMIKEPITIGSLVFLLFWQQPRLTMVAMVVLPLTMIPFVIYSRKVRRSTAAVTHQAEDQSKLIHEALTGYRIIKAYNLEDKVTSEFAATSRQSMSHQMRVLRAAEIPGPLIEFLGAVGVASFFAYIAFLAPVKLTPGDLFQFVGCIFMVYQPIKMLIRLHSQLEQAQVATQTVFDLLATKNELTEPARPKPLRAQNADIHFDQINFDYGDKPVLRDINLTVKAGQLVALVGSSGAGKTTLTSLLLRFYDPCQGAVRIGGTDIRDVVSRDLRGQISVVTQETILFNDTIRNNILLGRPGATNAEVEAAARHAHAHEFIMEKPNGYETEIGERGVALSGGQRQRLAIARAILKDAPILILDEATSALDTESERAVQAALEELMVGRTTICIAHRLSTIQKADVIVVLSQGRIVEMDTHEDLLKQRGHYQRLYELQFQ